MGFKSVLALVGIAAMLAPRVATADEVTLRAVSAFAPGTQFSKNFERFIEKVNAEGEGLVQIDYIGGPSAMPPFEIGNAVRTGVVDIINSAGAYYTNMLAAADATKLITQPMSEQRKNGTWEYINELHNEHVNAWYLARQYHNVPFHFYLNKKIDSLDFSGLKIRVTPIYRDFVEALGGTPVTMPPGDVYTAMERGVVDGYGWPLTGLFDLGYHEVTEYRVEPPFYTAEVNVLVNLDKWKSLDDEQRAFLEKAALWLEALDSENEAIKEDARKRQAEAGIEALEFSEEDSKAFLDKAYTVGWEAAEEQAPEAAPKLRELTGN